MSRPWSFLSAPNSGRQPNDQAFCAVSSPKNLRLAQTPSPFPGASRPPQRNFAVRIAPEDFGAGYPALSRLKELFVRRDQDRSSVALASTIFHRPPSNQPRIRPDARRRQLRVSLASPRYLVLRWRCGDLSHARLSRIRRLEPAMLGAFGDALPCALNDRRLRLLRHVRPPHHTSTRLR